MSLITAALEEPDYEKASGIRTHIEKGIADVCSLERERLSIAVWEFHLAAEKAVKTYLEQKTGNVPKSHNLADLALKAEHAGLPRPSPVLISKFPDANTVIGHRYGEIPAPPLKDVMDIYRATLELATYFTAALERNTFANRTSLLLKPLWR